MKILIHFLLSILVLGALKTTAHEGEHGPKQILAPHGGIIREGRSLDTELVKIGDQVKVYLLDENTKPIAIKDVVVDIKKTSLLDSKKKSISVEVKPNGDHFLVVFQKGSSHRYNFKLVLSYKGKENELNWQMEEHSE